MLHTGMVAYPYILQSLPVVDQVEIKREYLVGEISHYKKIIKISFVLLSDQ